MGLNIEAAKNYALSVAERTFSINAYKRWQVYAEQKFEPTWEAYQNRKGTGVFVGLLQFAIPAFTEGVAISWSKSKYGTGEEANLNPLIYMAKYCTISMPDLAAWMFLYNTTDNILQFVLYKLAANAATHVGLDLAGRAVDKLKGFRPPASATLTI